MKGKFEVGSYIGDYKSFKCYEVNSRYEIPNDTKNIYILSTSGDMFYGGIRVGKVNGNYKVLEFDLKEYDRAQKKKEVSVPVPACVAETTTTDATGNVSGGADELFARLTKDIDDILAHAKDFDFDGTVG